MTAIAVCCGKGAPGASFVSVNLAAALARTSEGVVLVDLDISGGELAAYLGLDPRKGLHLLTRLAGPRPDADRLRDEIQDVEGVGVIGGLPRPSDSETVDVVAIAGNAKGLGKTVIFDVGRVPGPASSVIDAADQVLVVVRPDIVSVLGAERCLAALESQSVPKEKIQLVVTAHRRRRLAELVEVGQALGYPVAGVIPWAPGPARRALEVQRPVASGAVARAFASLADHLTETEAPEPEVTRTLEAAGA